MTELQLAIGHLKEAISVGNVLLAKMEAKQKDLEKPPPHKWEHMDVFQNSMGVNMIFISCYGLQDEVFCIGSCTGNHAGYDTKNWLKNAKFLFNLKEKL